MAFRIFPEKSHGPAEKTTTPKDASLKEYLSTRNVKNSTSQTPGGSKLDNQEYQTRRDSLKKILEHLGIELSYFKETNGRKYIVTEKVAQLFNYVLDNFSPEAEPSFSAAIKSGKFEKAPKRILLETRKRLYYALVSVSAKNEYDIDCFAEWIYHTLEKFDNTNKQFEMINDAPISDFTVFACDFFQEMLEDLNDNEKKEIREFIETIYRQHWRYELLHRVEGAIVSYREHINKPYTGEVSLSCVHVDIVKDYGFHREPIKMRCENSDVEVNPSFSEADSPST